MNISKKLGFVSAFVIGTAALAFADSFIVTQNGKEYLCQETQSNPSGSLSCINDAYAGPFSRDEAKQLCAGATSVAPSTCAKQAYAGPFSRSESLQLCTGAVSTGPASCAAAAYAGPFSREESIRLCARSGTVANADCAKQAYAGPYSREEAIEICKSNPRLILRSINLLMSNPELRSRAQRMKGRD